MSAELDPKAKKGRPDLKTGTTHAKALGHGSDAALQEGKLVAFAAQALEAQKARKPLEQGGALEQVGARMKRVMGLTKESKPPAECGSA